MGQEFERAWKCLDCPEKGSGEDSDKVAGKHTKTGHSTMSWTVPVVQNSEQKGNR